MAKCCLSLGDAEAAKQALHKVTELEPSNSSAKQELASAERLGWFKTEADTAYSNKDYRKALFCLDRALEVAPASRQIKILRAESLAFLGRYPEAQELANDLLRQDSTCADAIYVRGLCLYYEDNVDKAFTHFQHVLKLAPDHAKARSIYKVSVLVVVVIHQCTGTASCWKNLLVF